MNEKIKDIVDFFIHAEKLKTTLRHSFTSNSNRQESTAEHTWMLCLIAMTLFEYMGEEVDQLRVLKILLIHDLAEAITGDIPAFEKSKRKNQKYQNELAALKKITQKLSKKAQTNLLNLWHEYEERKTPEGKLAHRIDKIEAGLQHYIADIKTWDQNDFDYHGAHYSYDYTGMSNYLLALSDEVIALSVQKITKAGQLHRLNEQIKKNYETILKKRR